MSDIVEQYNKIAHQNCIKKLHRANERIVEFEDIKKEHLKYVKKLKDRIEELEKSLERVKDSSPIECPDCFDAIADGYTICGDCSC